MVAVFLDRMARGEPTVIFGDGLQTRDFVYVGDVVEALLAAAEHDGGGVFNIGTGQETTVLALHAACARAAGSAAEARLEPARLGDVEPLGARRLAGRGRARLPSPDDARRGACPHLGVDAL